MAESLGMVQIKTAQEVMADEQKALDERNAEDFSADQLISGLAAHVKSKWADAKRAKQSVEQEMLQSLRQHKGEYEPTKLADIRAAHQPEIFMNITQTKCRNAIAWVKDILFGSQKRVFGIMPTPVPELPIDMMETIKAKVAEGYVQVALAQAAATGEVIPPEDLKEMILEHSFEIEEMVLQKTRDIARELAMKIEDRIEDDWVQYGFYQALNMIVDDIVKLKAGIVKGPIFRKEKIQKVIPDETGRITRETEERIVPCYERRSPFCIYPSPRSTSINGGYLFDVIAIKPRHLYDLIGVEGYDEKEIRNVLREFRNKELSNKWLELSQDAMDGMGEDNADVNTSQYQEESIYCLELWDDLPGELLQEWGLNVEDEDAEYNCCVWMIGSHVIKAMLNYDQLGAKPYSKTSFITNNDSFWGMNVPEAIADCQQVCNACARNILANIGIGALPQIGLNVDRLEPQATRTLFPGKVWPFTDEQMASNVPPVTFFQPVMVTEKLMNVYSVFSKIADEHSGVPAFAHGDSQVGGAGNTSSGLSMLISQASRGIKDVIRNIDFDIIADRAKAHYGYILDNFEIYGLLGDYHVQARGSEALLAKEQQVTRKLEYMMNTMNPVDLELVGVANRRKMLFDVAESLGIQLDEQEFPDIPVPMVQQQAPQEGVQTLDAAGNPAQGVDTREFNQERQRLPVGGAND